MTADPRIVPLVDWIVGGARTSRVPEAIIAEFGGRLIEAGVGVDRYGLFVETLHPSIIGRRFIWEPGKEVDIAEASFSEADLSDMRNSPIGQVFRSGEPYRRKIADPDCVRDYRILDLLAAEGYSDYLVQPLPFTDGSTHAISWCTRRDCGFSDFDLGAFEALRLPVARLAEVYALKRVAFNLLNTYVGERTGARILAGNIRRGDVEEIEAAIWLSDLREYTALSESVSGAELIDILNQHFDCLVPAIRENGGEVLKYMGDGVLAIFPTSAENPASGACRAALAAAMAARGNMAALNRERAARGQPELRFGIALHLGDVHYGNIGGGDRLDFTAIGPAVNLASRLGAVAATVGRDIVASAPFRTAAGIDGDPLGARTVKGFARPVEVYGIPA